MVDQNKGNHLLWSGNSTIGYKRNPWAGSASDFMHPINSLKSIPSITINPRFVHVDTTNCVPKPCPEHHEMRHQLGIELFITELIHS